MSTILSVDAPKLRVLVVSLLSLALFAPSAAVAALITAPSHPALAGALLQNFDSEATGDFASRSFMIGADGFTITPLANTMQVEGGWCDDFGTSNNCIGTYSAGNGANDDFDVVFTGAGVSAFGFALNALDRDWTITTYDASDNQINQYIYLSQSPGLSGFSRRGYFGATEVVPIQYFTVRSSGGSDWALIDDFSYAPIPEPGTALLAGLGLLGLASVGRPKRTRR